MFILLNNQIINAQDSLMDALTPGILKGEGVFETLRVDRGEMLDFNDHLKRMQKGLKFFHLKMPYSAVEWRNHVNKVLRLNHLKEARVRLMVWRKQGVSQNAVICQPLSPEIKQKKGWRAVIQKVKGLERKSPDVKSLDYSLFRKILLKVQKEGFDEAILVNGSGYLAEGTRSNLFFVKDKTLYTPAISCGCLRGITREHVLRLTKKLGMRCKAVKATPNMLLSADKAFVTNSMIGIMPLVKISYK